MITRNFNLYLNAGHSVPLVINVNQYDQGEQWVFTLYNSDGTQYTPSTGAIVGIKSDGLGIINTGSVDSDGRVVINETQQMTAAVGKAVFELMVDNQTHGTANFIVLVEPKPGDNADLSETDISMIEQAIEAASAIKPYGSPLVASTVAGMTDHDKVYVYVGSETGYTSGNWYYWDGSAWTSGGVYNSVAVQTDTTLTLSGVAADAKKTGDEISELKNAIQQGGGFNAEVKSALEILLSKVAYTDGNGQTYLNALHTAMYPPTNLVSISAVYTQSGTVYDTDSLDSLKSDLVVTAHYDDSSTAVITNYTLSGTLTVGTSTITVTYNEKTTTFNVTVSHIVTHTYANNQYIAISDPSKMVLTTGMVASGGKNNHNGRVDPTAAAVSGRAADTEKVLVGNFGGKTIGLSSYTLASGASVAFACWFGKLSNDTWDGTKYVSTNNNFLASAWLTSNVTLPASSDTNVLVLAFRKGNGSAGDFTAAELAEIPTLIQIS